MIGTREGPWRAGRWRRPETDKVRGRGAAERKQEAAKDRERRRARWGVVGESNILMMMASVAR